ncbi:MAG: PRC-barrel domain-containing protein, partial [Methylocella sp.]
MKRILLATCAIAALTGVVAAESYSSPKQRGAGINEVDAASMAVTFYTANPADFRASKLIGRKVYNLDNEAIGDVEDIIVDKGNVVTAIIVGVGGFLEMGERDVAISPSSMVISEVG